MEKQPLIVVALVIGFVLLALALILAGGFWLIDNYFWQVMVFNVVMLAIGLAIGAFMFLCRFIAAFLNFIDHYQ